MKDKDGTQLPHYTIASLMRGVTQEVKDITILLHNEDEIRNACQSFKELLTVMATFGGEQVVEFK